MGGGDRNIRQVEAGSQPFSLMICRDRISPFSLRFHRGKKSLVAGCSASLIFHFSPWIYDSGFLLIKTNKDSCFILVKGNLHSGQKFGQYTCHTVCLEGEIAKCAITYWLISCSQWLGTWKGHDWKIGEKDIWGRSMWIDLSKWEKGMKILISRVNVHQNITSVEEFNYQIDKMTLWLSASFPSHSCHCPVGPWTK